MKQAFAAVPALALLLAVAPASAQPGASCGASRPAGTAPVCRQAEQAVRGPQAQRKAGAVRVAQSRKPSSCCNADTKTCC